MPEPKGSDEQPGTENTRIFVDLLDKARIICAHTRLPSGKRLKLTDYLDSLLRERITRDHDQVMKRLIQEQQRKKP
jgi:hypothetical protein